MAAVRILRKQTSHDNGCGAAGCNVLQIVEGQISGVVDSQTVNIESLRTLILEKFDSMEKNNLNESNRVNELRRGDIEAVRVANDSAVKRADLLNNNLIETAETVRKTTDTLAETVRKTNDVLADTLAKQFQQITSRQDEKISVLEKRNWENSGKEGASPSIQSLVADLVNLKNDNAKNAGVSTGQELTKNSLRNMLAVAISIITVITLLINFFRG